MRALAMLIGTVAALAGSYYAFELMQKVGPEDRTNEYGYGGDGDGDLLTSADFPRVQAALMRELGADGRLTSLSVEPTRASAMGRVGDRKRYVEVDAAGRSKARDGDAADQGAAMPLAKLDAAAIDKLVASAREQGGAPVESLQLQSWTRDWRIELDGGDPDSFIGNLNGSGVRLQGEPNPEPVGASPDSLLREENLARVLAAARKAAPSGARVTRFDVRPERVSFELEAGGRELLFDYGYDADLLSRDVRARTGVDSGSIGLEQLDAGVVERIARGARAAGLKGLADVQYVLLNLSPGSKPELSMYLPQGSDPPYVVADLRGRRVTWSGRS